MVLVLCLRSTRGAAVENRDEDLKDAVVAAVEKAYYKETDGKELKKKSLSGVLQSLDKDSSLVQTPAPELDYLRGFKVRHSLTGPELPAPGVGYLGIRYFAKTTAGEFKKSAEALKGRGAERFILDLRGNGGGDLQSALKCLELFEPAGQELAVLRKREGEIVYRSSNPSPWKFDGVVLVDSRTASSAELVAESLRDSGRAKLVGAATRGKRTVQELFPVRGRWLALTVGTWRTEGGSDGPLAPDLAVEGGEKQLRKAVEILSQ